MFGTAGNRMDYLFQKSGDPGGQRLRSEIGVGASTPWQSCEGQDIMLRALANRLKGYYDPSIYGYHANIRY